MFFFFVCFFFFFFFGGGGAGEGGGGMQWIKRTGALVFNPKHYFPLKLHGGGLGLTLRRCLPKPVRTIHGATSSFL